jgi:hypothetical protein
MGSWLRLAALSSAAAILAATSLQAAGAGAPQLERGKGERCVEDVEYMKRNHPHLLTHHRDDTMRRGSRTPKHSLVGCVECHASSKTGSVAASKEDFCMACHVYTAVKVDCWECHATRPKAPRQDSQASPMLNGQPSRGGQN